MTRGGVNINNNYMFIWIENGKYITAINKKILRFSFWITRMISIDTENDMDTENNFEHNILRIFMNIRDDFLDLYPQSNF